MGKRSGTTCLALTLTTYSRTVPHALTSPFSRTHTTIDTGWSVSETVGTSSEAAPISSQTGDTSSETAPISSQTDDTSSETAPTSSQMGYTSSETAPTSSQTGYTSSETAPTSSQTGGLSPAKPVRPRQLRPMANNNCLSSLQSKAPRCPNRRAFYLLITAWLRASSAQQIQHAHDQADDHYHAAQRRRLHSTGQAPA